MRRWESLNERQLAVLRRIADGDELSDDHQARISARALHDRLLVKISKQGGWSAQLTDAGRYYLDHGHHPEHPRARPTAGGADTGTATVEVPKARTAPRHATARIGAERRAAAIALIAELVAESEKHIEDADEATLAEWRRVIDYAKRHHLVPEGKRIEKLNGYGGDLTIRLLSGTHANTTFGVDAAEAIIPMPSELRSPHPVVRDLRDDRGRLVMPPDVRNRALRFLQGLAAEAVRRGYEVRERPVDERYHRRYYGYRNADVPRYSRRDGQIDIVIHDFTYTVTIEQERPNSEVAERTKLLVVKLGGYGYTRRMDTWNDRKRSTIDEAIGPILRELELRVPDDQQRRADAEREKVERAEQWERAMVRARALATEAYHGKELGAQVDLWLRVEEIRVYADAVERRISEVPKEEVQEGTWQWLAWMRRYIDAADPLRELPVMSQAPHPQPKDLAPYLGRWSPYGPDDRTARQWDR